MGFFLSEATASRKSDLILAIPKRAEIFKYNVSSYFGIHMADILIKNGYLITLDKRRRIIKNGALVIKGDKITEVGKSDEITKKHKGEIEIDASGKIVMPGLIDCHIHLLNSLQRGIEDDRALFPWLKERVLPLAAVSDEEMDRISTLLSCLEMIKSGTTCFAEPYTLGDRERNLVDTLRDFNNIAEAVSQTGMRAALATEVKGPSVYSPFKATETLSEEHVKLAVDLFKKWHGAKNERIRIWFGATPLGVAIPELYMRVGKLAKEYDTSVHLHAAETKIEASHIKRKYKKTAIEFAHYLGLTGPNVLLVHMVWLTDNDLKLLVQTRTNVCHCPASNLKLASGFAKVPEMLEAGVNVVLGCDGAICNDSYDMIREMKLAALIHKGKLLSPTAVTAEQAIEMATINGARALRWDDKIGSIEKGKKADVILIDAKAPHMIPYRNLPSNLVYSGTGGDVDTVIIDGNIVMANRVVKTIDEGAVVEKTIELAEEMDRKAKISISPRWQEI